MNRRVPRDWLVRPMPIRWRRGPAWVDGDNIVMDLRRSTDYQPLAEPHVGVELSRVRTPEDATAFVQRFGMLRATREDRRVVQMRAPEDGWAPLREGFVDFEAAALDLHGILEDALLVQAAAGGGAEAICELRERFVIPEDREVTVRGAGDLVVARAGDVLSAEDRLVDADDRSVVLRASHDTAGRLNDGWALDEATPYVFDRAFAGEHGVTPGTWRLGLAPRNLVGVAYLSVALALADRQPIAICEDRTCRRAFFVTDGRQRFCTSTCANRTRYRRFRAKQKER
ncbi:MAG: CGNR zinc finger domain-containing protein [Acidobacteria bacterium]|nr:CGNR zinc finger domain-containing protein [Acidobacteriota bacterium]